MNWLKNILNGALNSFKRDVTRELDRAIGKLQSGQTTVQVVAQLHEAVADLLAKTRLPLPLGALLASLLMMVDWSALASKPSASAIAELERLKKQVQGARL